MKTLAGLFGLAAATVVAGSAYQTVFVDLDCMTANFKDGMGGTFDRLDRRV